MPARTIFLIRSDGPNWEGLRRALDAMPGVTVVGDTAMAAEAREALPAVRPQVIMSAATVEGVSAIPLLSELRIQQPEATIAVFSGHYTDEELMELGALHINGCLLWNDLEDPAFPAAHEALRSGRFAVCNHEMAIALIDTLLGRRHPPGAARAVTTRELAVLRALDAGFTREQIAAAQGLSTRTVKRIIANLERKLQATSPVNLGKEATRRGLLL